MKDGITTENMNKKHSGSNVNGRFDASNFQRSGKYFLLVLMLGVQTFIAYAIVDNSYAAVYSYVNTFFHSEGGQYQLEQIIVNPAGTNGQRYFLIELSLELRNKRDEELIEANNSRIRNNLIEYLSGLSVPELQGREGKDKIRSALLEIINRTIEERSVRNLYYSKYVMQ